MILRNKVAQVFFILSLVFALISMPVSGALSQGKLNRDATARVADDENALLKLKGFNDMTYNMNGGYTSFGSITNNTNRTITLTVTITPDLKGIGNIFTRLGIKIGTEASEFRYYAAPKQVTLTLSPGQNIDVKGYMIQNMFTAVTTEFSFTAVDNTGTFTMQLGSTSKTPRRIICY